MGSAKRAEAEKAAMDDVMTPDPDAPPAEFAGWKVDFRDHEASALRRAMPARDLNPRAQNTPAMWSLIKKHFGDLEPQVAVDVGAGRGAWSHGLLLNTKSTQLIAVDSWAGSQGRGSLGAWLRRMSDFLFKRARPLSGSAGIWALLFPVKFDLVFINSRGSYDDMVAEFKAWHHLLSDGGLFIANNSQHPEVMRAAVDVFGAELVNDGGLLGPEKVRSLWVAK